MTLAKTIARAWTDADYKAKLLNDPHAALADVGADVASGVTVNVMENTADTVHVVLPVPPASANALDESELEKLAGGGKVIGINID